MEERARPKAPIPEVAKNHILRWGTWRTCMGRGVSMKKLLYHKKFLKENNASLIELETGIRQSILATCTCTIYVDEINAYATVLIQFQFQLEEHAFFSFASTM